MFEGNGGTLLLDTSAGGKKKSSFWKWLLIIVVIIAVVAGGVFFYLKRAGGDGGFSKVWSDWLRNLGNSDNFALFFIYILKNGFLLNLDNYQIFKFNNLINCIFNIYNF